MEQLQIVKDTFYQVLRDRIAAANPARTLVLRGTLRPAVLTLENELVNAAFAANSPAESFCLRWTTLAIDSQSAGPSVALGCEIHYATVGSTGAAGMDRGRALAAMDSELLNALTASPLHSPAMQSVEVAGGGASAASALGWNIFWGSPHAGASIVKGERLERVVTLEVFSYGQ